MAYIVLKMVGPGEMFCLCCGLRESFRPFYPVCEKASQGRAGQSQGRFLALCRLDWVGYRRMYRILRSASCKAYKQQLAAGATDCLVWYDN